MGRWIKRLRNLVGVGLVLSIIIGCGSEPSPIESMTEPIRLVRNDSIVQVEDDQGRLYILNSLEKVEYNVALLDLGEELVLP